MKSILSLVAAISGLATFVCALPVSAQNVKFTLNDVTFNDGATASGYFEYNFTNNTFGTADILETAGTSGSFPTSHYLLHGGSGENHLSPRAFEFAYEDNYPDPPLHDVTFILQNVPTGAGTYDLAPGVLNAAGYADSGESYYSGTSPALLRIITGGQLIGTALAPVPEASTTVTFATLLILGTFPVLRRSRRCEIGVPASKE